jgi:hypothetical protein
MNPKVALSLSWILRLGLGGLFIVTGLLKLRDPLGFATAIANYQLFPALAGLLAVTLPTIEIVVGVAVVAAPPRWRCGAAVAIGLLLLLFTAAATFALGKGIDISCGCFGSDRGGRIGPLTLLRDLGLVLAAGAVIALELRRPAASSAR